MNTPKPGSTLRRRAVTAAAVVGTLVGTAGVAGATTGAFYRSAGTQADDPAPVGHTEQVLTDAIAEQVTAAALEAVPGGTVVRVETDDDGAAYEAHMTDADGSRVTVTFDETVTLIEVVHDAEAGHRGRGAHSDDDRDGRSGNHDSYRSEQVLTGAIAEQVTAATLEAVPGGTVERVEADDEGAAYEAHMTDADGDRVTVTFDETVTLIEIVEGH